MVLTSGELAGINLRAWFILIRRRKIFHGMEREFRFKVICTQGKSQNHSHDYDDLSFNNYQEQTGLPAQCKVLMAGLFPSKTSIHILTFTIIWNKGESGQVKSQTLPIIHATSFNQCLKEASKGSRNATGLSRAQSQRWGTW